MTDRARPGLASTVFSRVLLPLACGGVGGALVFALQSQDPRPSASPGSGDTCHALVGQVASLEATVRELGAASSYTGAARQVPPQPQVGMSPEVPAEARAMTEALLAEAAKVREEYAARRSAFQSARAERTKQRAEVELVKFTNLQRTISPEQTRANVERRLKRLALSAPDLEAAAAVGAPYIRQRSQEIIQLLQAASTDAPVNPREIEHRLGPLERELSRSLPSHLDEVTRRAIVTELNAMVAVPFVLAH